MAIRTLIRQKTQDPLWIIITTVIIASVLMVYPLPYSVAGWRPQFMLMVTLYWVMCQPNWCGVWFAFAMGVFTDMLLGMPLGVNALAFVLLGFSSRMLTREFTYIPTIFLWLIGGLAILFYILAMWVGLTAFKVTFVTARHWQPLLTSAIFFPFLCWILKRWRA